MKYQITIFEKSAVRLAAFSTLGIGLIGLTLQITQNSLPFGETAAVAGAWMALAGFLISTVCFIIWGNQPEAKGTKEIELENRVQVKFSEEMEAGVRKKLEEEIARLAKIQADSLNRLATKTSEMHLAIDKEIESLRTELRRTDVDTKMSAITEDVAKKQKAINDTMSKVTDTLSGEIKRISNELAVVDLKKLQQDFAALFGSFSAEITKDSIQKLLNEIEQAQRSVAELNKQYAQLGKSAGSSGETLQQQTDAVLGSLKSAKSEIDRTVRHFQEFNQN
jgi:uncharacterized protein YoxC